MPGVGRPTPLSLAVLLLVAPALFDASTARADEPAPAPAPAPACRYKRSEVIARSLVSGVFALGSFYVDHIPGPELFGVHGYWRYGTVLVADAPLLEVAPAHGLALEGLQLGSVGGTIALRAAAFHDARWAPYANAAETASVHGALYGTYEIYRDARLQGSSAAWTDAERDHPWVPATAGGLITAPFHPKNLAHPIVYVPLLTEGVFLTAVGALHVGRFGVGSASGVVRDVGLGLPLAFDAGVTEEAFFRGVLYEELKVTLGRWPATAIDATTFSLAHVPGELGVQTQAQIFEGIVYRAFFGFLAERAYEEGGLAESVTLHSLSDSLDFVFAALVGEHPLGDDPHASVVIASSACAVASGGDVSRSDFTRRGAGAGAVDHRHGADPLGELLTAPPEKVTRPGTPSRSSCLSWREANEMKAMNAMTKSTSSSDAGSGRYVLMTSGPAVNADDVELSHVAALEVSVSWGDNVLHVEHLTPPRAFSLGGATEGADGADYVVGEAELGAARRPLVVLRNGEPVVIVPPGAVCEVAELGRMNRPLSALVASGEAHPSGEVAGACEVPLPAGRSVSARLDHSELTFRVAAVCAGRKLPLDAAAPFTLASSDAMKFVAASFLAHAGLLGAMAFFLPALGATDAETVDRDSMAEMQKMLQATAEREDEAQKSQGEGASSDSVPKGDDGQRADGAEGKMGDKSAKQVPARYAIKRTDSSNEIRLVREQSIREMSKDTILGVLDAHAFDDRALAAVWGGALENGREDRNALGNQFLAANMDDAFGAGGLRLDGFGRGGGGNGQGIALDGITGLGPGGKPWGGLGTCSAGPCDGNGPGGYGIPNHSGRLGMNHIPHQPVAAREPTISGGGGLDPAVIQRIVRQNFGRFRMCYEHGLVGNPALSGRVSTKFVIARDGSVSTTALGDSDLPDANVSACVVRSFSGLSFPSHDGAVLQVTYPLVFTPDQ